MTFTSPLVNKLSSVNVVTTRVIGHKGNEAYRFLKRLGDVKFNPIRNTIEFEEICKNLKEYAVEFEMNR